MTETDVLAIDCRHLAHRYGHFTAVDDLSLQVRTGETVGLLGPNGAGKTTVVRVLTTLTPVQRGEVNIFGLDSRRQHHGYPVQHRLCAATAFDRVGADGQAERRAVRAALRRAAIRARASGRRSAGCDAPARRRRRAGRHLLRRHGPSAGTGAGTGEPAVTADPRRTDRWPGSHCPRQCLGAGPAHAGRTSA